MSAEINQKTQKNKIKIFRPLAKPYNRGFHSKANFKHTNVSAVKIIIEKNTY